MLINGTSKYLIMGSIGWPEKQFLLLESLNVGLDFNTHSAYRNRDPLGHTGCYFLFLSQLSA